MKGDVSGCEDYNDSTRFALAKMDRDILDHTLVHNLNSGRNVRLVSYNVSRMGGRPLRTAPSDQIKVRSVDLMEVRRVLIGIKYGPVLKSLRNPCALSGLACASPATAGY